MKAILAAILVAATLTVAAHADDKAANYREKSVTLPGLTAPAEIRVDFWGIPHIEAANDHDAFFVQGWNAARDRLWQIDLWRKRGLGRLAASFGPRYVNQDEAARLLLYRGDEAAIWAEFGEPAHQATEAFVAGINAYIAAVKAGQLPLPVEFKITASQPESWQSFDVVRIRSHGLSGNAASEVQRARVTCAAGLDADKYRVKIEPVGWQTSVPAGLDPCSIPADLLEKYTLGTASIQFGSKTAEEDEASLLIDRQLADLADSDHLLGSNNWAIGPGRTATGRPILANDPHRAHALPSLRYIAHLRAPGLDVIGAGEPSLPGISLGHNERIAFGLTISEVDQEDIYVYDLDPANTERYRYQDGSEAMVRIDETIEVKGEEPRKVALYFTRHGPVLKRDAARGKAFALRGVWSQPGAVPYFASMLFLKAHNWQEFNRALEHWLTPPENQVYADIDGNIGWTIGAASPQRANWDGLLPVPGDGRYEWGPFLPHARIPAVFNPPQGFVATANDYNLPADYPIASVKLGFEWGGPSRIDRIRAVLGANPRQNVIDSMALQTDSTTMIGCRFIAQLPDAPTQAAEAVAMLKGWDCRTDRDSAAAALYEIWEANFLPKALIAELAPPAARDLIGFGQLDALLAALENQKSYESPPETRQKLAAAMLTSLAAAEASAKKLMGNDPANWAWGKIHRARFREAVQPLADKATAQQLTLQPLAMGGAGNAPMAAGFNREDYTVLSGASVRMAMDVGAWDNSRVINSPGQSGDPQSPFYANLAPYWASGDYVPLLFSKAAIVNATSLRIHLTPATRAAQ